MRDYRDQLFRIAKHNAGRCGSGNHATTSHVPKPEARIHCAACIERWMATWRSLSYSRILYFFCPYFYMRCIWWRSSSSLEFRVPVHRGTHGLEDLLCTKSGQQPGSPSMVCSHSYMIREIQAHRRYNAIWVSTPDVKDAIWVSRLEVMDAI
ncbi:hypothetical protein K440DRAFT_313481 [Wilcoxina mikolae CBS 423.85]|nr:hypothetical protein K440DRAFT_313481 [Wilcoxina mikolae CBS 423.85]